MFHDKTGDRPCDAPKEAMMDTADCVLCKTSTPPHMHPQHMICDKSSDAGFQNWCSLLPAMLDAACPASPRTPFRADVLSHYKPMCGTMMFRPTKRHPIPRCCQCSAAGHAAHLHHTHATLQDTHKAPHCEAHQEYTGSSNTHAQAGLRLGSSSPLPNCKVFFIQPDRVYGIMR